MTRNKLAILVFALVGAGCLGAPQGTVELAALAPQEGAWQRVHVLEGQFGPAATSDAHVFLVPEGAAYVEALLTWHQPGAQLGFRLLDPTGEEAARGWNEAEGRAYVTTTHPVAPGEWTLEVSADRAIAAPYSATVTAHGNALSYGPIETTFVIPPRSPAREAPAELRGALPSGLPRDFAEVNLNMVPGDWFRFSWTATQAVYFNIHFHGPDGTQRPIEHRGGSLAGEFSADATEVYALLWRNEGTSEVEVQVKMDGAYRLHSMTRRA